jgi:ABC-type antimicrobial peptide transport system permease subunit
MSIIDIFFKYCTKQKLKKLQMFTQIFLAVISSLIFIGMIQNINNKLNEIKNMTSISNIKGGFYYGSNDTVDFHLKVENNLINDMKSQENDFEFCQFLVQLGLGEPDQIYIDNNLNKNINFPVCKGRTFIDEDFNIDYHNNSIPILVSSKLESEYPLNSEFKLPQTYFTDENNYLNGGANFKVIGILDDNSKFWTRDQILVDKLNYFETIIFPTSFNLPDRFPPFYFIKIKSDESVYNDFKNSIELKYNIKLVDSTLKKGFINKLDDKIIELIFMGSFTIVLLTLSLFGFISIIQSTILLRSKEIGIHYSLGGSQKNILLFIISEILLLSFLSIAICYLIFYQLNDYFMINYEILFDKTTFLVTTAIILIYILIAIFITSKTVLKKDLLVLLRE